jgi:rhodopsin domain-containing protein
LREKVILAFLMGFGLFASACAIAKMALISLDPIIDPTYDPIPLGVWAHLEQFIGFIAACVPSLKAPFEQILAYFGLLKKDGHVTYDTFSKVAYSEKDPNMRLNRVQGNADDSDEPVTSSRIGEGSV